MGLLDIFGGKFTKVERRLIDEILSSPLRKLLDLEGEQAQLMAEGIITKAKEEAVRHGTYNFPENLGDIILGQGDSLDSHVAEFVTAMKAFVVPKLRKEGVTDEDMRNWWNRPDVERQVTMMRDKFYRKALYRDYMKKGSDENAASELVSKGYPLFDDPRKASELIGDARPLPYELYDRVMNYMDKRQRGAKEKFEEDKRNASSLNVLLRVEIRAKAL